MKKIHHNCIFHILEEEYTMFEKIVIRLWRTLDGKYKLIRCKKKFIFFILQSDIKHNYLNINKKL